MAILTEGQYSALSQMHEQEWETVRNGSKVKLLGKYLQQSEDLVNQVANLSQNVFRNPGELKRQLAILDLEIDAYNEELYPIFVDAGQQVIDLGFDHTRDYYVVRDGVNTPIVSSDYKHVVWHSLEQPIPEKPFALSQSIWGPSNREAIYQFVVDGAVQNVSKNILVDNLVDYLTKDGQGGAYFKALRVVDTELMRAYVTSSWQSVVEYNNSTIGDSLLIQRKLSPVHRVQDICDELEGVYDPNGSPFPGVPSHPFCTCLTKKIFRSDYNGPIKNLSGGSFYESTKFPGQKTPLLHDGYFLEVGPFTFADGLAKTPIDILKDLGVYREDTEGVQVSDGGSISRNHNRYDEMMNQISKNLKGEDQTEAVKALLQILDPADPYSETIKGLAKTIYGIDIDASIKSATASSPRPAQGQTIGDFAQQVQRESTNPVKKLLPEFEDAVNAGNKEKAQQIIDQWKSIGTLEALQYVKSHENLLKYI